MKMELILASRNKKKIKEVEAILAAHFPDVRILSLDDVGYVGDIEENGETYEENALTKARTAVEAGEFRYAAIADDSGLSVDALDGAPGMYSTRYAGGHGDDAANNALLLKNLAHLPEAERTARFVCCIALVYPDGREMTVRGETEGIIIDEARGNGGFGYDPYFYYAPFGKTFAELSAEEKNAISHRGKAIAKVAEILKNI
ncbi:MAG: XTP/dITP diphosphatase [Clostridia bacterium]|nr:XTP/dITP diphosphatase [Clostridia bacterium]